MYYVYIVSNKHNTVLYTGVTNNSVRRMVEHRDKMLPGFTSRYNAGKLVYYEAFDDVEAAIAREKQIKAGPRRKKVELIDQLNGGWRDLFEELG